MANHPLEKRIEALRRRYERVRPKQALQWVQHLLDTARDLSARGERSTWWSSFFTHLNEALLELPRFLEEAGKSDMGHLSPSDRQTFEFVGVGIGGRILKKISEKLTDEELIYLTYRRHCTCHLPGQVPAVY